MLVPTIGMEVHVELKSKTKVFSDSLNDFSSSVNNNVNEIDLGYPGVLPKLNKEVAKSNGTENTSEHVLKISRELDELILKYQKMLNKE